MAQPDRRAAAAGEFIGKDVFLKSFTQQSGNISATQLTALVSSVQNVNLSVLKVGAVTVENTVTVVTATGKQSGSLMLGLPVSSMP